jgi:hypothetical protein
MKDASLSISDRFARKQSKAVSRERNSSSVPFIRAVAEAMALGKPAPIGGNVIIWRDIDRVGADVVVHCEVETIAAGLRGMLTLCAGERGAIRLEARYRLITSLIGGLIQRTGFTRRSRCRFACAVRPTRASRRHLVKLLSLVAQPAPG